MRGNKGSYTLETAITFFVVFVVMLFLMAMGLILYEENRVTAIAQDAAERAAVTYSMKGKEMITGRIEQDAFQDTNVYWRLFDFNQSGREEAIRNYIDMKLNAYKINPKTYDKEKNVNIEVKNYFLYKRISIDVTGEYQVPFGGILQIFLQYPYPISAHGEATVQEQSEMIRNVDMVKDYLKQTKVKEFQEKWNKGIEKIRNIIEEL